MESQWFLNIILLECFDQQIQIDFIMRAAIYFI